MGREGPIIQIGSALGSTLGQMVKMPASQRIALVAAGAGAGIAATFNTPIGGVMFAIELMLPEVGVSSFLPVAISTGAATFIGRWLIGDAPAFQVPHLTPLASDPTAILVLVLYAVLGALAGAAAAGFVRGLHLFEDLFDRIPQRYLRHILGMLIMGCLMYALFVGFGQYFVDGVGYATIEGILNGQLGLYGLLGLLFAAKMLATSLSLGSGSSGGIFSPSLFMGATLGGCFRGGDQRHPSSEPLSVPAFAMVGMGAMVGGGTGAVMTAVVMIFEMTLELRHHHADDRRRGDERRRAAGTVARNHLHPEACAPRPGHPEGPARQHVPGAPRARCHGRRRPRAAPRNQLR